MIMDKLISEVKKLNFFGSSSKANLPVHGGTRSNGVSFNTVNFSVLLTVVWLLASIGMFGLGVWHCRNRASFYKLSCDVDACELLQNQNLPIKFQRKDLTSANAVRINAKAEVVETNQIRSKYNKQLGYSVELKFQYSADPGSRYKAEKKLLFSPEDMGSGPSRQISKTIHKYIYKPSEPFEAKHAYSVTTIGLSGIIFGIMSTVLCILFGQWQDTPRRLKKSS